MVDNPVSAMSVTENRAITTDMPYTTLLSLSRALYMLNGKSYVNSHAGKLNMFGFSRADLSAKLLQMLKYGNFINSEHSNLDSPMFGYSAVKLDSLVTYGIRL